jgi:hypothetical protein
MESPVGTTGAIIAANEAGGAWYPLSRTGYPMTHLLRKAFAGAGKFPQQKQELTRAGFLSRMGGRKTARASLPPRRLSFGSLFSGWDAVSYKKEVNSCRSANETASPTLEQPISRADSYRSESISYVSGTKSHRSKLETCKTAAEHPLPEVGLYDLTPDPYESTTKAGS